MQSNEYLTTLVVVSGGAGGSDAGVGLLSVMVPPLTMPPVESRAGVGAIFRIVAKDLRYRSWAGHRQCRHPWVNAVLG